MQNLLFDKTKKKQQQKTKQQQQKKNDSATGLFTEIIILSFNSANDGLTGFVSNYGSFKGFFLFFFPDGFQTLALNFGKMSSG